jgi:hypothetical protein
MTPRAVKRPGDTLCKSNLQQELIHTENNTVKPLLLRFLGSLGRLQKATVSFIMSVRPSAWNNSVTQSRKFNLI